MAEATGHAGIAAIGRYFVVVSLIPSTLFVTYLVLLFRTGAAGKDAVDLAKAFRSVDLKTAATLAAASLIVALALHPLQFSLIQLLEGYWGTSQMSTRLALIGILRHRRRARRLYGQFQDSHTDARDERNGVPFAARADATQEQIEALWTGQEALRSYSSYPHRREDIMPTSLGNVLRRYEQRAGLMFHADAVAWVPRLMQVADSRDVEYVTNQRMQLELAVRTCALGLLATVVTVVVMLPHAWYLLLSLVPYAVAFLSYRGAIVLAHEYGTALTVLVELNRFVLYERLHLEPASTLRRERTIAKQLTNLFRLDNFEMEKRANEARFRFVHPEPVRQDNLSTDGSTNLTE